MTNLTLAGGLPHENKRENGLINRWRGWDRVHADRQTSMVGRRERSHFGRRTLSGPCGSEAIIEKALSITENCDCDPSCYMCLRNYYNQKIHNHLNRHMANMFLSCFSGTPEKHDNQPFVCNSEETKLERNSSVSLTFDENSAYRFPVHENWNSCSYFIPDAYQRFIEHFEKLSIRLPDYAEAEMKENGQYVLTASLVWKNEKVLLIDDSEPAVLVSDWTCVKLCDTTPEQLKELL